MKKGIIITYVLVFGAIFLFFLSGLLGFILLQLRETNQKVSWNESFEIAEAGINYYRWCLNNEVESQCQLEKEYRDTAGNSIGKFSLQIASTTNCELTTSKEITSTGWTYKFPDVKRVVRVFYNRESVAKYSYILNSNVWVGADHEIRGPYHSNGGIRMDGENQSLVTSVQTEWVCTDSFGCGPKGFPAKGKGLGQCPEQCRWDENKNCICPGVFTTTENSNPDLFSFPIPPFDFTGITIDLAQIKTLTQPYPQQYYWPPSKNLDSRGKGYHLKFINNGTFEVWIITGLSSTRAYSLEEDWHDDYFTITSEYRYQNPIPIDPNCSLIFFEDNLWPEGVIKGKVTVASANLIDANKDTDVILQANLDYSVKDGSDGLTLIGERNALIGPNSPNQMELRGIFVAQKGRFSRNHYPNNIREKLEISGVIISNGRVGTQWISGSQIVSGYLKRETYVDPYLIYNPPVFTPFLGTQYKIVSWEEL